MNLRRLAAVAGGVLFVGGVLGVALREPLMEFVMDRLTADMFVQADTDAWNPGPEKGVHAPLVSVVAADGIVRSLDRYFGPRGLLVFFNRSVDW